MAKESVGEVSLNLSLDTSGLLNSIEQTANSVDKSLTSAFESAESSASDTADTIGSNLLSAVKKLGAAVASAFAVKKIKEFAQSCVEAAAEVKALNSQFEQTFGTLESTAESIIQEVADESGILESRLQSVGTSIYAFAKTTGMDSATALTLMQDALEVTADSAAYYDKSLEDVSESLQSFLKGNYENDAALGLSCTETTRNTAANKLYGKSFSELSESQKQLTLLQMVKDANELSGAMGQAAREADGWENVTGNLSEAWKQFLAVIGEPLLEAIIPIIQKITSAIETLTKKAQAATQALAELFGWDLSSSDTASTAESTAESVSDAAEDAADAIEDAVDDANSALASFDNLNVLSLDSDDEDESENAASTTDTSALSTLTESASDAQDAIDSISFDGLVSKVKKAYALIKPLAETTAKGVATVASAVTRNVSTTVETARLAVEKLQEQYGETVKGYVSDISSNLETAISSTCNATATIFDYATESQERNQEDLSQSYADFFGGIEICALSFADVFSSALAIAGSDLETWVNENEPLFSEFFDGLNEIVINFNTTFGTIFEEIGTTLTQWWEGDGESGASTIFDSFIQSVLDMAAVVIDFWNTYIQPFVNYIIDSIGQLWDEHLQPLWQKILDVVSSLMECITVLWDNLIRPIYDTFVKRIMVGIAAAFESVWDVIYDVISLVIDIITDLLWSLQGVLDFITGIFSGDMELAFKGLVELVGGVFMAIWDIFKTAINLIIDALNIVWSTLYGVLKSIIDGIGDFVGLLGDLFGQDWGFSLPDEVPKIPRLAQGGLVTAPTLALVGDNQNASTDPEVVSPLSKLEGMLDSGGEANTEMLSQILMYLKMLYELLKDDSGDINITNEVDGDVFFKAMISRNKAYARRHSGKGAFS